MTALTRLAFAVLGLAAGAAVCGLAGGGPALAREVPETFFPQVDARVSYVAVQPGTAIAVIRMRLSWHVASGMMRVEFEQTDPSQPPPFVVLLRRGEPDVITALFPAQRSVVRLAGPDAGGPFPLLRNDLQLTEQGPGRAAGQDCTLWDIRHPRAGGMGQACITEAGIPLRFAWRDSPVLEAESVSLAAQEAADFMPPPGWRVQGP